MRHPYPWDQVLLFSSSLDVILQLGFPLLPHDLLRIIANGSLFSLCYKGNQGKRNCCNPGEDLHKNFIL